MRLEITSKGTGQRPGPLCLILADDLTGACDAAAPFASRGLRSEVSLALDSPALDSPALGSIGAPVLALNTSSRDLPKNEAHTCIRQAVELWQSAMPTILFKKIDSIFRGNTFAEIEAMMTLVPGRIALLAPSYPAAKRRVREGCLFLDADDGSCLDIASELKSRGMHPILLKSQGESQEKQASLRAAVAERHHLILCDAETGSDIKTLASAGLSLDREVLWIGSGGLAHAIADTLPVTKREIDDEPPHAKTLVFCIGSDHPKTIQQVEHICRKHTVIRVQNSDDWPQVDAIGLQNAHLLWEIGFEPLSASAIQRLSQQLRELPSPALFLSGGDTAMRICEALGVRSISLYGEIFPGVPWGVLRGGMADGIPVITKSGGFGEVDTLTLLARICSRTTGRRQSCI
jgi:uncharacterized protein YgbK (DUF1537 family)